MSLSGWTGASSDSSRSLGSTARRCAAASVDGPTDFQPELDAEVNLSERGGQPPVPAVPWLHSTGLFLLALEHATGGFSLVGVDIVGLHESPDLCHPHLARGRACRDVPAWIALAGELARRLRMHDAALSQAHWRGCPHVPPAARSLRQCSAIAPFQVAFQARSFHAVEHGLVTCKAEFFGSAIPSGGLSALACRAPEFSVLLICTTSRTLRRSPILLTLSHAPLELQSELPWT